MRQINYIIFALIFICITNANAQNITNTSLTVTIAKEGNLPKYIKLTVFDDYLSEGQSSDTKILLVKSDGSGKYQFKLNMNSIKHAKLEMENELGKDFTIVENYLEPTDQVQIDIVVPKGSLLSNAKQTFSGKGEGKFHYSQALSQLRPNNLPKPKSSLTGISEKMEYDKEMWDSISIAKKRILDSYKGQISQAAYKLFKATDVNSNYGALYRLVFIKLKSYSDTLALKAFYAKNKHLGMDTSSVTNGQSYWDLFFLMNRAVAPSRLEKTTTKHNRFESGFNSIVAAYDGVLREKVLLLYVLGQASSNNTDFEDKDPTLLKSFNYIKNPTYTSIVKSLIGKFKPGVAAYNFKLEDLNGKIVSLSDFKGKTVIIDCWFTGCYPCSALYKKVETEVKPQFENNSDVVFLSVNVDKTREQWRKSIASGLYTSETNVNLFTQGLELKHPFIKNYNFGGFPQLMLVDKNGLIFSELRTKSPSDMVSSINKALKQNLKN